MTNVSLSYSSHEQTSVLGESAGSYRSSSSVKDRPKKSGFSSTPCYSMGTSPQPAHLAHGFFTTAVGKKEGKRGLGAHV